MHELIDSILVVGHHNPDTDASVAAVCYADYLNQIGRYPETAVAAVPNDITTQAHYVFENAGKSKPFVIDNVTPRVGHVYTKNADTLSSEQSVGEATRALIQSDVAMLPIVDQNNRLAGVFSNRSEAAKYLLGFDPLPLWGSLLGLQEVASMPGMTHVGDTAVPKNTEGELHLAVEGDNRWKNQITNTDTLICGDLSVVENLTAARRPRCVIVLNDRDYRGFEIMQELNREKITVLQSSCGVAEFLRSLTLHMKLSKLEFPTGPCVGLYDNVSDVRELLQDAQAVPVVDDEGQYLGIISRTDLTKENRCRLILVDHFETTQSVPGLEDTEVIEIVDHHRIGDIQTSGPIRVDCRPVGSSCTIIAQNFLESKIEVDRGTALLLLGGIVADTLVLAGPTTTDIDRRVAKTLAEIGGVDIDDYGAEVLMAGDDLLTADPSTIWNRDQKSFSIRNRTFSVAQLETVSITSLPDETLAQFAAQIRVDREENDHLLSLLVLTDVMKRDSWLYCSESPELEGTVKQALSQGTAHPGWMFAPGIVSRKKQIVPSVMEGLAQAKNFPA